MSDIESSIPDICPVDPEIDSEDYTLGGLMLGIMIGEIPVPVWIRCGPEKTRVTPETKEGFVRGLQLALSIKLKELEESSA